MRRVENAVRLLRGRGVDVEVGSYTRVYHDVVNIIRQHEFIDNSFIDEELYND